MNRLKHSFTSGELSPLMNDRVDFERFKNGCKTLENAFCLTQGPASRRPGTKFIYDLNSLGLDVTDPRVREIPFIFNESQAYVMIFFMHTDGDPRVVFGKEDGLVVYGSTPITECPPGTPVTPVAGDVVVLTLPTTWDIEGFDWAQSADEMYFAQSVLQPYVITRYDSECWVLTAKTFASQPAEWTTDNWPETVTFHQQRLVFGANTTNRQTVWMTEAGDFGSFAVNPTVLDSDAVTFTLDSGTQNKIVWMTSAKSLNIGTIGNEWTVAGGTQTALTPSNVLAQKQTNSGSEENKPLTIGVTTLFIERHGRTINEFVQDQVYYDSYKTTDLAVLAPHLTEDYSITDWAYQQTPHNIVWCVREDGALLGLTYQRDHKVVGWHRHTTDGEFRAISVIPGDTREDDVWFIVKREVGGVDKYFVEKLEEMKLPDTAEEGRFLDSFLVYDGTATDTITGLDHLEGLTVHVLADGTVHPPVVVSSGGITLNNDYSVVVAGLQYITEIRPNLVDPGLNDGTSLGRTQRITHLYIDFYKTLGCEYGKDDSEDGESVEELPFRVPGDLLGVQVPLFTGFKRVPFLEGFDTKSEYFLRQEQPLPMTIRAIADKFDVYK